MNTKHERTRAHPPFRQHVTGHEPAWPRVARIANIVTLRSLRTVGILVEWLLVQASHLVHTEKHQTSAVAVLLPWLLVEAFTLRSLLQLWIP